MGDERMHSPENAPRDFHLPQVQAAQAINQKAADLTAAGAFGQPTTEVTATPDGIGYFRHYDHGGSIYWTFETGAHELHGAIRQKWADLGWERGLGYPTIDETKTPDGEGRFVHFTQGSIYSSPNTGAHEVHGAIRDKWASLGWESGDLGFLTSDESANPDPESEGRYNTFQRGFISWNPATGASEHRTGARYHFAVDQLVCYEPRSGSILGAGNDTVVVTVRVTIDGQDRSPVSKNIGEVGGGFQPVGVVTSFTADDPGAPLVMSFQMVNSKDGETAATIQAAEAGFDALKGAGVGAVVGSVGGVPGALLGAAAGAVAGAIKGMLFNNCDGLLAADTAHLSGASLNDHTAASRHVEDKRYPGVDSPGGCGANSDYGAHWGIKQDR